MSDCSRFALVTQMAIGLGAVAACAPSPALVRQSPIEYGLGQVDSLNAVAAAKRALVRGDTVFLGFSGFYEEVPGIDPDDTRWSKVPIILMGQAGMPATFPAESLATHAQRFAYARLFNGTVVAALKHRRQAT